MLERRNEMNLDVVIITKNQDWNIRRLVESVLNQTSMLPGTDVILVDSASTDTTVEMACQYPIRVIRLSKCQRLTAAAGRQAGITQTGGDIVLFLDGDMELRPGWIDAALSLFEREPGIAVISGEVVDQPRQATGSSGEFAPSPLHAAAYDDVLHGGGAAAYRRSVLDEVGSFNPYLFSDEEPELCLRIREAGHRIVKLRLPIADHYSDPSGAITTLFGRRKRNLYLGPGQALRLHVGSPLLVRYAKERGFGLVPGAGMALGAACASMSVVERNPRWILAWATFVAAIFGIDSIRKHSLHRALFGLVQRFLFAEGTVRGFMMRPTDPVDFSIHDRGDQVKLLVVTAMYPTPENPAFGSFVKAQVECLRTAGVDVEVMVLAGRRRKLIYPKGVLDLRRRLRRGDIDLVHAHYSYVGMVGRMQRSVPLVVTYHGSDLLGSRAQDGSLKRSNMVIVPAGRLLSRFADAVIVQSKQMAALVKNANVHIVPHEIDFDLFRPADATGGAQAIGTQSR